MTLDRWIAMVILAIALAFAYSAFFTMDQMLPPFMQRNPGRQHRDRKQEMIFPLAQNDRTDRQKPGRCQKKSGRAQQKRIGHHQTQKEQRLPKVIIAQPAPVDVRFLFGFGRFLQTKYDHQ